MSLAKNAATFTIMADGIPIIYAGQEQHYKGGSDPNNREATWLSGYNTDSPLYKLIGKANAVRNQAIFASDRYLTYKVCFQFSTQIKYSSEQNKSSKLIRAVRTTLSTRTTALSPCARALTTHRQSRFCRTSALVETRTRFLCLTRDTRPVLS